MIEAMLMGGGKKDLYIYVGYRDSATGEAGVLALNAEDLTVSQSYAAPSDVTYVQNVELSEDKKTLYCTENRSDGKYFVAYDALTWQKLGEYNPNRVNLDKIYHFPPYVLTSTSGSSTSDRYTYQLNDSDVSYSYLRASRDTRPAGMVKVGSQYFVAWPNELTRSTTSTLYVSQSVTIAAAFEVRCIEGDDSYIYVAIEEYGSSIIYKYNTSLDVVGSVSLNTDNSIQSLSMAIDKENGSLFVGMVNDRVYKISTSNMSYAGISTLNTTGRTSSMVLLSNGYLYANNADNERIYKIDPVDMGYELEYHNPSLRYVITG